MKDYAERNRLVLHFIVLPSLLLTVVLLGGLRVDADTRQFVFLPPPLVTLLLAALLSSLFLRAGTIDLHRWLAIDQPLLTNLARLLTLLALFFASAQAFNSVLPESGLLHWMFSFFFLWTLWTNQFSAFDARRLVRSLIVLFATAFVLKHLLVSSLYGGDKGWLSRLAGSLLQGASINGPGFAPSTGYISFVALALYVCALLMMSPSAELPKQQTTMLEAHRDSEISELASANEEAIEVLHSRDHRL
jgi:hypothetical protein